MVLLFELIIEIELRMSLNIEMCMLGLTFGACFGSIFGMNLKSGLEDNEVAFSVTAGLIVSLSMAIVCLLVSISSIFYTNLFCQYFGAKNYKAET